MTEPAEKYGPYVAALLVLLAMILLVGSAVYNINQQRALDERLCEHAVQTRMSLRVTFETSRDIFKSRSDNPAAIDALFKGILRPIPPLECRDNQPVPKEDQ